MPYDIIIGRNKEDKEKFGKEGLILLGRGYVKMGNYTSLSNNIYMDVARPHVVLVAGKRGSGKCLHEDTLITLSNGMQIPIKDLENNKEKILSLNDNLKIEESEKTDFFSRETTKLLKLKLRSGKEIKLTPEHPLLTIKGWQEAQNLRIGNKIATPRINNNFGTKKLEEHEIKLLAYLITEGHTKNVVLFSNTDEKIVEDFKRSLLKFDDSLKLKKEKEGCYRISCPTWKNKIIESQEERDELGRFTKHSKNIYKKRSIRELIEREEMHNLLATQKYLSNNLMQLNKKDLSLFLNRMFSCDGSIYKTNKYWSISYSSSSKKMIKQIQHILLRYGILSKLRSKKIKTNNKLFDSFELVINSENTLKFIEEIGFFGTKAEKQKIAYKEIKEKIRNPNVDTIPKEIWEFYKPSNWSELGRKFGYKYPKAFRERLNYAPSRQTLLQIAEIEQNNPLLTIAQSDIFWDEILSMEILEGQFKVYDICVPTNHNFVANDIIVHNSYTLGVLAEELANLPQEVSKNIASIIFDTMGIYWTIKYKNEKDYELLKSQGLEPKNLPANIFIPYGKAKEYQEKNIPFDKTFALSPAELEAEEWISLFNITLTSLPGVLIEKIVTALKEKEQEFTIDEIKEKIKHDSESSKDTKEICLALFSAAESWGVFSRDKNGTTIKELVTPGTTTVLDVSVYSSTSAFNIRALVLSLVAKKIFKTRMDARKKEEVQSIRHGSEYLSYGTIKEDPLVWIFIDEAHEFLPKDEKTPATDALIQLLREGRQPGISMALATQQPGKIHTDVMTQSDIIISHKVTSKQDVDALNAIMQTYLLESIRKELNDLPSAKGSAIILDDNSERLYPIRIRPRFTWHGGEAPTAIKTKTRF
jgi:intein/homing endonuclease